MWQFCYVQLSIGNNTYIGHFHSWLVQATTPFWLNSELFASNANLSSLSDISSSSKTKLLVSGSAICDLNKHTNLLRVNAIRNNAEYASIVSVVWRITVRA